MYDLELKILSFLKPQKNAILNVKIRYFLVTIYLILLHRIDTLKIEVTQRARTETILGKSPPISNGHQPPRADYPYGVVVFILLTMLARSRETALPCIIFMVGFPNKGEGAQYYCGHFVTRLLKFFLQITMKCT